MSINKLKMNNDVESREEFEKKRGDVSDDISVASAVCDPSPGRARALQGANGYGGEAADG